MCLGIPAQITAIDDHSDENSSALLRQGTVSIGSVTQQVYLGCVPSAQVGDYVLLHAGIAISTLDADEAQIILSTLSELTEDLAPTTY